MRKPLIFIMIIGLLLLLVSLNYSHSLIPKNKELVNGARFEITECWFDTNLFPKGYQLDAWLFGLTLRRIECGYLSTRKEQNKSVFRLPVVIIRDSLWRNSQHPVLNIAGGPGGASWLGEKDINGEWLPRIKQNDWHHDIILYDTRGTGLSQPALHCDHFLENSLRVLAKNVTPEEEAQSNYQLMATCHQKLEEDETLYNALHHLGTVRSAHDIADLADTLGVESLHLYGTSYGTRVALEVARRYPDHVASMILDSVYPQEIDGEETMPDLYLDAIERILTSCEEHPLCGLQYPNIKGKLHVILQRLAVNPITLTLYYKNRNIDFVVTPSRFFSLIYNAGYGISIIKEIPNVITSLYRGETNALQFLAQNDLSMMLDESFSNPTYMEVECNENEIKNQQAYINNINKKYQYLPSLKRWQLASVQYDFCKHWGAKESDSAFHQAVISNKPILVLAGKLDSATPSEWGKAVAQRLPNSEYHEFKASGHAVLYNIPCARDIVRRFLNPDKQYLQGCNNNNPIDNGQGIRWE